MSESDPVTVAIDILDEDHSLRLALRRLAGDADLRARLGAAGQRYWQREHSIDAMLSDYRRLLPLAAARPAPRPSLPPHLVDHGTALLRTLAHEVGLDRAPGIAGMLGQTLTIRVNGEPLEIAGPLAIAALLAELGIDARRVAVEHNLVIVKRDRYDSTMIGEGDEVEIVNFVGGGAEGVKGEG